MSPPIFYFPERGHRSAGFFHYYVAQFEELPDSFGICGQGFTAEEAIKKAKRKQRRFCGSGLNLGSSMIAPSVLLECEPLAGALPGAIQLGVWHHILGQVKNPSYAQIQTYLEDNDFVLARDRNYRIFIGTGPPDTPESACKATARKSRIVRVSEVLD